MKFKFNPEREEEIKEEILKKVVFSGCYEDTEENSSVTVPEGIEEIAENAFDYSGYEGRFKAFLAAKGEPK